MPATSDPIVDPRVQVSVLAPDEVRRVHEATLEVIESVGVRFPSPRALDIWAAHGATVDRDTSIVRVPGHVIEDALRVAPPVYTLAARDPALDLPLDGRHVYAGTDGCGVEVLDLETGERRRSGRAIRPTSSSRPARRVRPKAWCRPTPGRSASRPTGSP